MGNPFKFGGEVSGYQFYDRTEAAELLRRRLLAGSSNVVMFAPRRYGKTSLVSKVLRRINAEDGVRSLMFDLSMVSSVSRFCAEYVNAVYAMAGGRKELAHKVAGMLAECNPSLTFGVGDAVKVRIDLREALTESSICEVLDLPERLAEELGVHFVVAFDEFQEITEISSDCALEKVFRSRIQKQQRVHYVFLGSKAHLMERMFSDHARPFYNSALAMPLGKPPSEESREFVRSRFADGGIDIGEDEISAVLTASDNIPYYLQEICSLVYDSVSLSGSGRVASADVVRAADDMVAANANYHAAVVRSLSEAQRALVLALAQEPAREFDEGYRRRYGLSASSTIHSALKELLKDSLVDECEGCYRIGDPTFARYLLSSPAKVIA